MFQRPTPHAFPPAASYQPVFLALTLLLPLQTILQTLDKFISLICKSDYIAILLKLYYF